MPIVYFRTLAKELVVSNALDTIIDDLGDLAVWKLIIKYQD